MVPLLGDSLAVNTSHEPPLTPGPSPVGRERVARASLEPGEGFLFGRFMDPIRGKSLAIYTLHERFFGVQWKAVGPRQRFESGAERRTPWHPFMVSTRGSRTVDTTHE